MPSPQTPNPERVRLLDGKLHLYRRANSQFWWGGFYHHQVFVRRTTRCQDLEQAKEAAKQLFYERQLEIKSGAAAPTSYARSFGAAVEKALDSYQRDVAMGNRSDEYVKGLRDLLRNRVVPFLGKYALESVNQTVWNKYKEHLLSKHPYKPATIHQHKIAVRIVLKQAQVRGELASVPQFFTGAAEVRTPTPRVSFSDSEYRQLVKALRANISGHKNTRWHLAAQELLDYVLFVTNSGLRVGEARNVRFCDVAITDDYNNRIKKSEKCLLIKNIMGKRGTGECKTYFGAVKPFLRCATRQELANNWKNSERKVFTAYHRDMFREVLATADLRFTRDRPTPRRRDLMSLRHTYICFRLQSGAAIYDVAANCRTSVEMIEAHYARWLSPAKSKTINVGARAVYDAE